MTRPVWLVGTAGGIESNLARPRQHFHLGGSSDVHQLAALYASAFATTQHFVDGNKRTAFACVLLFLELNGWRVDVDPLEAAATTLALANKTLTAEAYGEWLKEGFATNA